MFQSQFYPFDKVSVSDSCWSLSTGPDGRIYASICTESMGGVSVYIARYNPQTDGLDYVLDVAEATGHHVDSGHATHCKIHYGFMPSLSDGVLYAATHLSAPPGNGFYYSSLSDWRHPRRGFSGSLLMAYDTAHDRLLWHDIMIPREGARCCCLDEQRGRIYSVSYPRDHLIVYDLDTRKPRDLGRIGSVNSQAIFSDRRGRVYTADQYGRLLRYDPDSDDLRELDCYVPVAPGQSGWHAVLYDVVEAPAGDCVYGISWNVEPQLFRYWPEDGPEGRMEPLGSVTQARDRTMPVSMFLDHAGGLVFGPDDALYYVRSEWPSGAEVDNILAQQMNHLNVEAVLMRLDPKTLEKREVHRLTRPQGPVNYATRGAMSQEGEMFFGMVCAAPNGFFRVRHEEWPESRSIEKSIRYWG